MRPSTLTPFVLLALGSVSKASPLPQGSAIKNSNVLFTRDSLPSYWEGRSKGGVESGKKPSAEAPPLLNIQAIHPPSVNTSAAQHSLPKTQVDTTLLATVPVVTPFSPEMSATPPPPRETSVISTVDTPKVVASIIPETVMPTTLPETDDVKPTSGLIIPGTELPTAPPTTLPMTDNLPATSVSPCERMATPKTDVGTVPAMLSTSLPTTEIPIETAPFSDEEGISTTPIITQDNTPTATQNSYPVATQKTTPTTLQGNPFVTTQIQSSGSLFPTGIPQPPQQSQPGSNYESNKPTGEDTSRPSSPSTSTSCSTTSTHSGVIISTSKSVVPTSRIGSPLSSRENTFETRTKTHGPNGPSPMEETAQPTQIA